jgi:hypothetical protein
MNTTCTFSATMKRFATTRLFAVTVLRLSTLTIPVAAAEDHLLAANTKPNDASSTITTKLGEYTSAVGDARFSTIDRYVADVPKSVETSPEKLAAYLMRVAGTDVEKARAIARWINANVSYDFEGESLAQELQPSSNADAVFAKRRALSLGYANLFTRMMRSIGIETVTIQGWKKGFGYTPGDSTTLKRHAWNAFKTRSGAWMLLDVSVRREVENGDGVYKTSYADGFFCIQPEHLIYSHFPDDAKWQLLDKPLSKAEFQRAAQYFGAFYGFPVTLHSHKEYEVTIKTRSLVMEFDAEETLTLGARVYGDGKEVRQAVKWSNEGRKRTMTVKFPAPGTYKLELTVAEMIAKSHKHSENAQFVGCAVKTVAEYEVVVELKGKMLASGK